MNEEKSRIFQTVCEGKLYHWGDHTPWVGLESVTSLPITDKRRALFGRCDIDQQITAEIESATTWFDTYLYIELEHDVRKIFLPAYFLGECAQFQQRFGNRWPEAWPQQRSLSVACAMNKSRYPRVLASCWLANHAQQLTFSYTQNWDHDHQLDLLYELLQIGELKDWTGQWGPELLQLPRRTLGDPLAPLTDDHDNTARIFEMMYPELYRDAAACVIIGAVCWERACEICEKYVCAVYSGCIPLVQGYRAYDRLSALGFDVFEDIIDTASQYELNPVRAAWDLWHRNLEFFQQATEIAKTPRVQQGLLHNFRLAQDLSSLYRNSVQNLNSAEGQQILQQHKHEIWQKSCSLGINLGDFDCP